MKKYILLLLPIILWIAILPVSADAPRLVDYAELITDMEEEYALEQKLNDMSETYSCDVVIVTTNSLDGKTAQAYADDYYDLVGGYGYGDDYTGILFLISMGEREWAISTCGEAIAIFDDYRLTEMENAIVPYLSDGDYYAAFSTYADLCETYLTLGVNDVVYDNYGGYDPYYDSYYDDYYYSDVYPGETRVEINDEQYLLYSAVGSVAVAFVVSLIIVTCMKGELNTVRMQSGAANYEKKGSFRVTSEKDIFLYRKVTKVARDTDNHNGGRRSGGSSVHRSSSGRSHGGRSGRF